MLDDARRQFDDKMALVGVALHRRFTKIELNALAADVSDHPIDIILPVIEEMCQLDKFAGINILAFLKAGIRRQLEKIERATTDAFDSDARWYMEQKLCCLCENTGFIPVAKLEPRMNIAIHQTCITEIVMSCRCPGRKEYREPGPALRPLCRQYETIYGNSFQFPYSQGIKASKSLGEIIFTYYDVYRIYFANLHHLWKASGYTLSEIPTDLQILNYSGNHPLSEGTKKVFQDAKLKGVH